jgi:cobalt/nickel transport system permease protein
VAALSFILETRPDLLGSTSESARGSRGWVVAGVLIALAVVLLSPLASADPDGLNRVATDLGFIASAQSRNGPLAGYAIPLLESVSLSKITAGVIGVAVVGAIIVLLGQGMKAKS